EPKVGLEAEPPMASITGEFVQETELLQAADQIVGAGLRDVQPVSDIGDADNRLVEQALEHAVPVPGGAPEVFGDATAAVFLHDQDSMSGFGGVAGCIDHSPKEEGQPAFPVTGVPHGLQVVVVRLAVAPEVVRQVEDRAGEQVALHEEEGDQQSADTAVAVEEGM